MPPVKTRLAALLAIAFTPLAQAAPALAQNTHYVAPKDTTITCQGNHGEITCPWTSVNSALQSGNIAGGDTLLLMNGMHDRIVITGQTFTPSVAIEAQTPHQATVDTVFLRTANGLTFRNLMVYSTLSNPFPLFRAEKDTSRISLEGLKVQSVAQIDSVLSWTKDQWLEWRRHGVWLGSSDSQVVDTTVRAVQSGIWSSGRNNKILNNKISEVTGDGLRAGSQTTVRGNHVANFLRVDTDHIDGFQSIGSTTDPVTGLVFAENRILEWTHGSSHPLQTSIQGIGMFDGFYDDFLIQNNVISISAHHGIAVYGGRGGRIVNNTVVQRSGNPEKFPWIGVFNHKNSTPSRNIVTANNLAMAFAGASATNNVVLTDNSVVLYPDTVFSNVSNFDYRLQDDSPLIDKANPLYAPGVDIEMSSRPSGGGPDLGAFEVGEPATTDGSQETLQTSEPILERDSTGRVSDITSEPILEETTPDPVSDTTSEPIGSVIETAPDADPQIERNTKPVRLRKSWSDGARRRLR